MSVSQEAPSSSLVTLTGGPDQRGEDAGIQRLRAEAGLLAQRIRRVSPLRLMLVAATFSIPLGFAVILLAWQGAARVPREIQQNPYVISGGLGGVALVLLGGLLLIAFAVIRAAEDQRARDEAQAALLRELVNQLKVAAPVTATSAPAREVTALVTTARGKMAHRPDCQLLGSANVHPVSDPSAMEACQLCQPDLPAGRPPRARRQSS